MEHLEGEKLAGLWAYQILFLVLREAPLHAERQAFYFRLK